MLLQDAVPLSIHQFVLGVEDALGGSAVFGVARCPRVLADGSEVYFEDPSIPLRPDLYEFRAGEVASASQRTHHAVPGVGRPRGGFVRSEVECQDVDQIFLGTDFPLGPDILHRNAVPGVIPYQPPPILLAPPGALVHTFGDTGPGPDAP